MTRLECADWMIESSMTKEKVLKKRLHLKKIKQRIMDFD